MFKQFIEKLTPSERKRLFSTTSSLMKFVEGNNLVLSGQGKKEWVKENLKKLIDFPNVPDWIEDAVIDEMIDLLAALLFPKD